MSFDSSTWYSLNTTGTSLVSSNALYTDNGTQGSVYLNRTVDSVHYWQIFPMGSDQWILRSLALGPNATMQSAAQPGKGTGVTIATGDITNASLWSFTSWGTADGTYYLTNQANGTGLHLDINPSPDEAGLVYMNPDISYSNQGQRWIVSSIGKVTQTAFSTAPPLATIASTSSSSSSSPSTSATATSNPSTTPSASSTPASSPASSGLSTGAKAGIGAGIAGAALLLIVGALIFYIRRRRGYASVRRESNPPHYSPNDRADHKGITTVYAHRQSEDEGLQEMDNSNVRHEMYAGDHIAELEGNHGVKTDTEK